jgi:hypothetical protein
VSIVASASSWSSNFVEVTCPLLAFAIDERNRRGTGFKTLVGSADAIVLAAIDAAAHDVPGTIAFACTRNARWRVELMSDEF